LKETEEGVTEAESNGDDDEEERWEAM